MVKVYYGSNIDAIGWKVYNDNIKNNVVSFPIKTSATEVADRLCQFNLFESDDEKKVYVVNIDSWKLTDTSTKGCIKELHALPTKIIFILEGATVRNKIFSELKIETVKATAVTKKVKATTIHSLLVKAKIGLDPIAEQTLVDLLPENIDFIKNEITKLQLMGQSSFTKEEIEKVVFDLGDATIFNIADAWLAGDEAKTIERLNDLIAKNVTIQAFIPIFALKLVQIKFFLTAKLERWSSDIIATKQGLPFWQQALYSNLRPYDQKLTMIDQMLTKLYEFDINVKKQKNIPYTQLIKILFK